MTKDTVMEFKPLEMGISMSENSEKVSTMEKELMFQMTV